MKIAGFTFVRNALKYDYPVVESIMSVLPLCDYLVVAVGQSEDGTLDLVRSIDSPKIHILPTVWDDTLREGGRVLALETQKAFEAIPAGFDWCLYIQADECLHENDLPLLREQLLRYKDDPKTEGFVFDYRHFYGSYDYVGVSRRWYRREVRIIRNDKKIKSYRDAQGFRWENGTKLRVRPIGAKVFHYGWVKHPEVQQQKQLGFNRLWHSDEKAQDMAGKRTAYLYDGAQPVMRFTGTHPKVMLERISKANWEFDTDPAKARWSFKDRVSYFLEKKTGWIPGEYRNYRLLGQ